MGGRPPVKQGMRHFHHQLSFFLVRGGSPSFLAPMKVRLLHGKWHGRYEPQMASPAWMSGLARLAGVWASQQISLMSTLARVLGNVVQNSPHGQSLGVRAPHRDQCTALPLARACPLRSTTKECENFQKVLGAHRWQQALQSGGC